MAADLASLFAERLGEVGGRCHEAGSLAEARELAARLIDGDSVARWEDEVLAEVPGKSADDAAAEVSLVVAEVGVSDTGQIGWRHGPGRRRGAGILPERQVALLAAEDIVQSVAEALARFFAAETPPASVVFVAGPSRTADIEQRLILGVHAPRELDVVVYRS